MHSTKKLYIPLSFSFSKMEDEKQCEPPLIRSHAMCLRGKPTDVQLQTFMDVFGKEILRFQ